MSDLLASLATNPAARKLLGAAGVPLPARLGRDPTPWRAMELADQAVVVGFASGASLAPAIATTLAVAGADPTVIGDEHLAVFTAAGEAWSRPVRSTPAGDVRALVFDASGVKGPDDLRALFDFFGPRVRGLGKSGRAVVLGRPPATATTLAEACARRGLEGFVRSLGRELGRFGSTSQLVTVTEGAEERLAPALRFLLSPRSAFISGQPWHLGGDVRAAEPRWVRPLDGRVVLVTGAARGIGAATAAALAREGAKVVVLDLPCDEGEEVAKEVGGVFLACDLAAPGAAAQVATFVQERYGRVDGVIHNAGITRDRMLANMPPEVWDLALNVNLGAVLRLQDALDPLLGEGARVVCLSSIAGIAGNVGQTNYAASKAGIIGFVEALGPKLASRGIAVNAIAPGFIETRLTHAIPAGTREVARRLANLAQGGLPGDIAEVAVFLVSPGASGLCGQVLRVCGGSFIGA